MGIIPTNQMMDFPVSTGFCTAPAARFEAFCFDVSVIGPSHTTYIQYITSVEIGCLLYISTYSSSTSVSFQKKSLLCVLLFTIGHVLRTAAVTIIYLCI